MKPQKAPTITFRGAPSVLPSLDDNDGLSIIKVHIRQLISEIQSALPRTTNQISKLHLQDLVDRLKDALKPKDNNS